MLHFVEKSDIILLTINTINLSKFTHKLKEEFRMSVIVQEWKKSDYMGKYYDFDKIMRNYTSKDRRVNIEELRKMPGYEALRIMWMLNSTCGEIDKENVIDVIKENSSIATNIEQEMKEVLNAIGEASDVLPETFVVTL